jgi:hypothetical protein
MVHSWLDKYHSGNEEKITLDDPFENAKFQALITGYKLRWEDKPMFEPHILSQRCEESFAVKMCGHDFGGKLDTICLTSLKGGHIIVESKTSGEDIQPGSFYWQKLQMDMQVGLYWLAVESLGMKPEYVLYNVIGKVMLRPKKAKTEETPEEFYDRIVDNIAENPDKYYQRGKVILTSKDLENVRNDIENTVRTIDFSFGETNSKIRNPCPRHTGNCYKFNRACDFFPVCNNETSLGNVERYRKIDPNNPHEELKL